MPWQTTLVVDTLNWLGAAHWQFAAAMFLQVGLLVAVLAVLDVLLLRRMRAIIRCGVWGLVLVKLVLPVSLQGPLSLTGVLDAATVETKMHSAAQVALNERTNGPANHRASRPAAGTHEVGESEVAAWLSPPASETNAAMTHSVEVAASNQTAAKATVGASLSWQAWLLIGWSVGVSSLLVLFTWRLLQVRKLIQRAAAAPPELHHLLMECQRRLGLEHHPIRLKITDELRTPAICGLWRATILYPQALLKRLDDEQKRLVFVHELMHWKRCDLQLSFLQTLLQVLYFYNPIVWICGLLLRQLREQAVDEAVLVLSPSTAERYSSTLVDIVAFSRPMPALSLRMVGVVESRTSLAARIRRILHRPVPRQATLGWSGAAIVLLVGLVLLPLAGRPLSATDDGTPIAAASQQASSAAKETVADQPKALQRNAAGAEKPAVQDVAKDEIAGTVLDVGGQPLAGVTVDAWHWHPGNETKTDARGEFRLKGLDPKTKVEVLISKEGFSPQHFAQRPTGAQNWVVVLNQKTYFEGTVLDTVGEPVADAKIRASFGPVEGDGVVISEVTTEAKSEADGKYRLYLAPGSYDLQVSAGKRGVFRQSQVVLGPNEAKLLPVRLQEGVRFEAQAIDSITGAPVEGFVLWQWRSPRQVGRSDAEGRIVFDGQIPGKIEFNCGGGGEIVHKSGMRFYQHGPFGRWWSADALHKWQRFEIDDSRSGWQRNFDGLEFDLKIGMQPVTITVEKGVTVTGRVTDPQGKPVQGATVAPARTGSGNSLTGDTRYSETSDKEGNYRVVLPASNKTEYNLVVHDGDYGQWRKWANGVSESMQTTPGQVISGLDLQLTEPAIVRGRVLLGGRGIGGRDVRTHDFDKRENRYYDPTTQTKEDGTFELKFVRPGKHYLQVEPFWLSAEQAPAGSKVIEVKAGQILEGIELTAAPVPKEISPEIAGLPFKARILDAQNRPVPDVPAALGILGGLRAYTGKLNENLAADQAEPRSNKSGELPLSAGIMAQWRQDTSLVFAVDNPGRRAAIAVLNLQEYAEGGAKEKEKASPIVDLQLVPATVVKLHFDSAAFKNLKVQPTAIYLSLMRDSLPLQQSALAEATDCELLLPPGTYKVLVNSGTLAEAVEAEFTLKADQPKHEVKISLQPSHLARIFGQAAPPFEQVRAVGEPKPALLADLKGKVVVLDFWGHWCGPCIAAMPNLFELYDEFHDQGVEFIAIHDDSVASSEELRDIMAKLAADRWKGREIPFRVLLDGGGETLIPGSNLHARGATTTAYGITAFPTTLVIDQQGRVEGQIQIHDLGSARKKLNSLLGKDSN
jgi:beta-lactamase regulating signal transducer with metallopeptidase domain/thiol-disulfide isomerase/thioredoxin/protocatechuate 3,4-dioxygenase beta subunit